MAVLIPNPNWFGFSGICLTFVVLTAVQWAHLDKAAVIGAAVFTGCRGNQASVQRRLCVFVLYPCENLPAVNPSGLG